MEKRKTRATLAETASGTLHRFTDSFVSLRSLSLDSARVIHTDRWTFSSNLRVAGNRTKITRDSERERGTCPRYTQFVFTRAHFRRKFSRINSSTTKSGGKAEGVQTGRLVSLPPPPSSRFYVGSLRCIQERSATSLCPIASKLETVSGE